MTPDCQDIFEKNRSVPDRIINLRKPVGWTSFDVVRYVKRIYPRIRVGHAGTLDPFAEGVLLVCVGKATKQVGVLMQGVKSYRAQVRLGLETDTLDVSGQITASQKVPRLTRSSIEETLTGFVGEIRQIPPVFSALRVGGKRAYHAARKGKPIEMRERTVRIDSIELIESATDRLWLEIVCSKGTYIRALSRDIASALGTVGFVQTLLRTRVGDYELRDSLQVADLASEPAPNDSGN
ncbi:tRNA pseudouridine(55) synthase TruB [candidate division KSB1 bacterium]|nr:tRNA pseudouridine(55) synthase TruB [candidate division KSB1 bacterium]